jgi:hypothetical protein
MAKEKKGKPALTLVYTSFMEAVARVRMFGVKKYGHREDWRTVPKEDYYDAAIRHLQQAKTAELEGNGEVIDFESKELHLAHCACDIMFLIESSDVIIPYKKEETK